MASIYFSENLVVGTGRLHIDFSGELNDRLKGFYRIKTVLPNGESRYSAATQFEAADARRAFPSWDEPAFKASFDITIFADKHKTVLSNMVFIYIYIIIFFYLIRTRNYFNNYISHYQAVGKLNAR